MHITETPRSYPLISVITVTYNCVDVLEKTMLSVIGQEYPAIEYILIDGGSTDGTLDVIRRYADRIAYLKSEPDKGIYDAMNKGIDVATGDWIIFMNAGDRFADRGVLDLFRDDAIPADIIYGDAMVEYHDFSTLFKKSPLQQMWKRMPFCHQATFVRTPLLRKFKFDLRYRLSSDFDFIYKAYLAHNRFIYIDKLICYFDFQGGASRRNAILSFRERKAIVLSQDSSIVKQTYFACHEVYLRATFAAKKILGNKLTIWLTRLLRA